MQQSKAAAAVLIPLITTTPPFAAAAPLSWFSDRTAAAFKQHFQLPPTVLAAAPGRVNLIGEHVDYNGGWVLPAAIERWIVAAAAPREDGLVTLHDTRSGETACFSAGRSSPRCAGMTCRRSART